MSTKRINLTMTRKDAASLWSAIGVYLDECGDGAMGKDVNDRVARTANRLLKLLKRPDNSKISIFARSQSNGQ